MNLLIGAIFGFISVAFGAYAEHGLKTQVSIEHFDFIMTAVRYNQSYAILISAIGLAILLNDKAAKSLPLKLCNLLFIVGTTLFSFGIYIAIVCNVPTIMKLAPIGGTTLMLAWILLGVSAITLKKSLNRTVS